MDKLSEFDQIFPLVDQVKDRIEGSTSLEDASNRVLDVVMDHFQESIVLTRVFATVPYRDLPPENTAFVDRLAGDIGVADRILENTQVLSLIASRGVKPDWNDRRRSAGHVSIPLVSADFVEGIPMIARLLAEVGVNMDWLTAESGDIDVKTLAQLSGVFFVEDAATAVDGRGRKIISAQDFVSENGVKTVFGMGGGFAVTKTFLVVLFFCNETLEKSHSAQFLPLISTIKAATAQVITQGKIFAQ